VAYLNQVGHIVIQFTQETILQTTTYWEDWVAGFPAQQAAQLVHRGLASYYTPTAQEIQEDGLVKVPNPALPSKTKKKNVKRIEPNKFGFTAGR
jgi:hypothetical protein